ncbi:KRI1-like family C-terminal-domain-containing protein [Neohortaea acidophila]|uniref:KRI1-like family C-terminal-domain-containing protein n=1 Tax=Neohortaea acidophila TaxID=245834 RepID=A0A6A6PVV0_9PEZI|nr:KRI1-like family C-terminal-domain-containing protein [Neohortaea acidophila]KAF2484162.1 KRI1-like family C-terminal-domain-containing protein [Neohortaea acidophila]
MAITTERPAKRAKLLSDESSSEAESESDVAAPAAGPTNGFKVNEEYARRFEHNKKREEMHRLEEKYHSQPNKDGKGRARGGKFGEEEDDEEDSEEDESEDDDGDLATRDVDEEIFATLKAIKEKDPRVYDKGVTFYREFEGDVEGEAAGKQSGKEKPVYLQDYHRQNLLAGYTGEEHEEADDVPPTYDQEQDAVRQQLPAATAAAVSANGVHPARATRIKDRSKLITDQDVAAADQDPERYLSNFMAARAWVPSETSRWQAFDSDDSDEEKRADEFEEAYNLRFEDPNTANEKLQSFARDVGKYGVRRDEKTARQKQRDRERETKDMAKREREEERARLRKLKIEEAEEKVKKIKEAAGMAKGEEIDVSEWKDVLDGDFDDDMWEKEMKRRFGDDYYAGGEEKVEKPTWDDDIAIDDLVPDFEKTETQVAFTLSSDEDEVEEGGAEEAAQESDEDEDERPSKRSKGKKKDHKKEKAEAKRTARRERRQIESIVDSSLPLSHPSLASSSTTAKEPVIGFRYRETSPITFGLSARDILFADDTQLNQYAGLKKMAAFRDAEKKRRDKKKYSKKGRLREWRREVFGSVDGPKDPVGSAVVGGEGEERKQTSVKVGTDQPDNVVEGKRGGKKRKRKSKAGTSGGQVFEFLGSM